MTAKTFTIRALIASVLAFGLAVGLSAWINPAQASQSREGWYTWETTYTGSTPPTANTITWPQTLVGKGKASAFNLKCDTWYQQDKYKGSNHDIWKVIKDGQLVKVNGVPEDSNIVTDWKFVYGGDCPPPPAPEVTLGYVTACGSITLTTDNNESVPSGWYYGLQGKVGDDRVVSAVQQGPGYKEDTKTFEEDYNGGSVDVIVSVYASTEQDLLPSEWPYGKEVTVTVETDCETPEPSPDPSPEPSTTPTPDPSVTPEPTPEPESPVKQAPPAKRATAEPSFTG